jgi:hypothetical protein
MLIIPTGTLILIAGAPPPPPCLGVGVQFRLLTDIFFLLQETSKLKIKVLL